MSSVSLIIITRVIFEKDRGWGAGDIAEVVVLVAESVLVTPGIIWRLYGSVMAVSCRNIQKLTLFDRVLCGDFDD